ncbi:MAG TPA: ABC transporter ATP-binding protein [Terrimesophilobacter sp.]|nr:ABC transporter ATP-binding protein [Terrimesophilobacter sp.]
MAHIDIKQVNKSYGGGQRGAVTALENINLRVNDGEFVSIIGPSGCGKSTLLYIVGGFVKATQGEILVDNVPVKGPGRDRGVVFQEYALFPWRTVLANVTYGLERAGVGKRERLEMAHAQIEAVGLKGFEHRYPKELSGGMKQRVAIARTLAYSPDVLLLDEPYGALDAQTREQMQDQLMEIWGRTKTTVVMVTHDVNEAVYLSQRVVVMSARPGTIVADIPVNLNHSGSREDTMLSPEFNEIRNTIWLAVREEMHREESRAAS